MATNKTENFGLNQWEKTDPVRAEDFNEDNRKLDAALHGLSEQIIARTTILTGSYIGDGTETRTISLPFTPSLLIVQRYNQPFYLASGAHSIIYGGITAPGQPRIRADTPYLTVVDNGFQIYHGNVDTTDFYLNSANYEYYYIAFP